MIPLPMSRDFACFSKAAVACALAAGLGAGTGAAQQSPAQLHLESRGGPAHADAAKPAAGKQDAKDSQTAAPQPATPQPAAAVAAAPARVTLNQGQLTVNANNSDLRSILTEVASSGGMTIEGLDKSSRVFGQYGPGAPRDVLTALLDDTGYNFVMLGGANGGVPRELVLTTRSSNSLPHAQAQAAAPDDDANADDQEPLGPGAIPHPPPEPSDDPQERAQEHLRNLQRMQDILQQRQEQQQEQQDNNPQ